MEIEQLSNTVTKEAVNEVVLQGTRPPSRTPTPARTSGTFVDHNGQTVSYKAVLTGSCTASPRPPAPEQPPAAPPGFGNVAVNPNIIPYGTKLYICSPDGQFIYGYAVAADTGGALMNNQGTGGCLLQHAVRCYAFGRRTMTVYIL